ncbi:MAG: hypothetical protein ACRCVK_18410, partial [Aeromonas veronii]
MGYLYSEEWGIQKFYWNVIIEGYHYREEQGIQKFDWVTFTMKSGAFKNFPEIPLQRKEGLSKILLGYYY